MSNKYYFILLDIKNGKHEYFKYYIYYNNYIIGKVRTMKMLYGKNIIIGNNITVKLDLTEKKNSYAKKNMKYLDNL